MDNARKDGPLDGFDAEVKALIARIVDARAALDTQVKDFERRDREGRRAAVQFTVDSIKSCEGVPELDIPINPSWLNKSTRQAEILEDIKRIMPPWIRTGEGPQYVAGTDTPPTPVLSEQQAAESLEPILRAALLGVVPELADQLRQKMNP